MNFFSILYLVTLSSYTVTIFQVFQGRALLKTTLRKMRAKWCTTRLTANFGMVKFLFYGLFAFSVCLCIQIKVKQQLLEDGEKKQTNTLPGTSLLITQRIDIKSASRSIHIFFLRAKLFSVMLTATLNKIKEEKKRKGMKR